MTSEVRSVCEPLPDRDNDFVRDIEAVGLVDDGKLVDRRHHESAGAALCRRLLDRARQFVAQACTVQMSGQFVAGGEVGKAGERISLLGDLAHHPGDPFGAPLGAGNANCAKLEPAAFGFGERFEFQAEIGIVGRRPLDNRKQPRARLRRKPPAKFLTIVQLLKVGEFGHGRLRAVPADAVIAQRPIEGRRSRSQ